MIGGVTVRHASLHNAKNASKYRIGDVVMVELRGDVIPYISGLAPVQIESCGILFTINPGSGTGIATGSDGTRLI